MSAMPKTAEWEARGACRKAPDLWFETATRDIAIHICLRHCPVLTECRKRWAGRPYTHAVIAGVPHNESGRVGRGKAATTCERCIWEASGGGAA